MTVDFLSLLDETNSIKNEETGEITLTIPVFDIDKSITIKSECKITSNCNTVIKSTNLIIISQSAFINNISFETPIIIKNSFNVNLKNCSFKNKEVDCAIIAIINSRSIFFDQITIKDIKTVKSVIAIVNSHLIASHLFIDASTELIIGCVNESKLYMSDSQLIHSNANGIWVLNNSYLEMENCKISETICPPIYIEESTGKIYKSEINNTQMNGIVLKKVNSFDIANNKILNINGSAISIINDSNCNIHNNIISKINNNAIYVDNNSYANIYKNELSDIRCPGIAVLKKSKADISENKISNIKSCGIRVINSKKMEINKNEIKNIDECAISILNTKKCCVANNEISNCKVSAVESYNNSNVKIINNYIFDIKEYAFQAYTSGKMNAENNTIKNVGKSMVKFIYNGGGDFINNNLENCPSQIEGQTSSQYYFNKNGDFSGITNDVTRKTSFIQFEEKGIENTGMCINCNKKPRKCYLLSCGHKLYCEDCAKEAHQSHKKCPLCRLPIIDLNEGFKTNDEICQICLDHKADCIIMPCGHIGYCHKCLNKWFKDNYSCPYCQIEPVTFRNIQDI